MVEKIIDIISEEMDIAREEINAQSNLYEDLGLESMDLLSMVLIIEENFGVRFGKEDISDIKTVTDIETAIKQKQEN